jgi:hypothetical protein
MTTFIPGTPLRLTAALLAAATLAMLPGRAPAADIAVTLSGAQEAPPVETKAAGSGTITIGADKSVSGSITTKDVAATMAHIHIAPAGKNGPVIIPLTPSGDNGWTVPAGSKLNDEQAAALAAGNLYVNVHSAKYPGGEIRGQLKP